MMEIGEANVRCVARSDKWSHLRDTGHPWRIRKFRECSVFLFLRLCERIILLAPPDHSGKDS